MLEWPYTIARQTIVELTAYSARGGATQALHLDANESPWMPPPSNSTVLNYNRYPEQQPPVLRARLAELYGTQSGRIMIGRGADEAIDILLRSFCRAGEDSIVICSPTFGYFKTAAQIQGANITDVPLKSDFTWDIQSVQTAITQTRPKLVFLCSPNNPTGNSLKKENILSLCEAHPETLIVVDEAYIEFSPHESVLPLQTSFRNLIVTRTLSKVYGLAGVRLGVCIADPAIIDLMLKVLPPYSVSV